MATIQEITDKIQWEDFLRTYTGFFPFFQTWNWGEVQQQSGFPVIRLGIFGGNTLVGICLITDIDAKRGHYFHLRHGPVLGDFMAYFDDLLIYVKKIAYEKNVSFLRISPLIARDSTHISFLKKYGFRESLMHAMDAEICWVLDITKSEEELLADMRKSHRYLIRKAPGTGLKIHKSTDVKDVDKFMPLYQKLAAKMKFVPHKSITEEFEIFSKDNQEMLFLAEYEGKIISSAFIAFVGNMAIYRHSAGDDNYRHVPAAYFIQWEAIKEAKARGLTLYNFWGVAPDNSPKHPWNGFTLFKTGFGGEKKEFLHAQDLPLSPLYWKNYLADMIDKVKKGY